MWSLLGWLALGVANAADAAPEGRAPATVLDDRLDVVVERTRQTARRTWRVRIDDPGAVRAGLTAPSGLDGATDQGARILGDLLVVPDGTAPGTVFAFTSTRVGDGAAHSGVFATAPDLPVIHAEVSVRAPAGAPLSVWTDPLAEIVYTRADGAGVRAVWDGIQSGDGELVYSTWGDWFAAGQALQGVVAPKLGTAEELGRVLGSDLVGLSVPRAVARVQQAVALTGPSDDWRQARSAHDTARAGKGTAVDRGVVLISMLRAAGLDARPAYGRPASARGAAPVSLPAPALLPKPLVAVTTRSGTVWIDPGNPRIAVPDPPAAIVGGLGWAPGDLPVQVGRAGEVDGLVAISAQATVAADGSSAWSATITAHGVALEHLRSFLAPMSADGRRDALLGLVRRGHPNVDRFVAELSGVEDPYRTLKIVLQGHDDRALRKLDTLGLAGEVAPLLAPALAARLPPRVLVREDLSVVVPPALLLQTATAPERRFHPDATLARAVRREGARLTLVTEVERPYRATTPLRDAAAAQWLDAEAPRGPDLVLLPPANPDGAAVLAKVEGLAPAEREVLAALAWWQMLVPKRGDKLIQHAVSEHGSPATVAALVRFAPEGDPTPFERWLAFKGLSSADRLAIARGAHARGHHDLAWAVALAATTSPDPSARVDAILLVERWQSATSPADPAHAAGWRAPEAWLADAAAAHPGDPRVAVRRAELALASGRASDAEVLLDPLLAARDPYVMVLHARAAASAGVAEETVAAQIEAAVALAPFDAAVVGGAGDAMAEVGRIESARVYRLAAARLDPTVARWSAVVGPSLRTGDLASAVFAARRASDADPRDVDAASQLAWMAALAGDGDAASLAASRGSRRPMLAPDAPLDARIALAPEEGLLAVLDHHDGVVVADPGLLRLRAQLRLDAGHADDAARDGALLLSRYGEPRGAAVAFVATLGRLWSSRALDALVVAARTDSQAAAVLDDVRLIAGLGGPLAPKEDPRARALRLAASDPQKLAAEVPGWPSGLVDPVVARPRGYVANPVLGGAAGVVAWSDPERARALVVAAQPTGGLPPPLALLYTPRARPLRALYGGGQLLRLEGGPLPLYAAIRIEDGLERTGLGFTPEAAVGALVGR